MKGNRLLGIILLMILTPFAALLAQEKKPCGTQMSFEQTTWLRNFKKNQAKDFKSDADCYYVPIKIHIVGDNDGDGYYNQAGIYQVMCDLNAQFEATDGGMQFFIHESGFDYHNRSDIYIHEVGDSQVNPFINQTKTQDMVNMYVVAETGGACAYYTPGADAVVLDIGCIQPGETTTTHELGHFFSLHHTFYGWEYANPEPLDAIDGPNNFAYVGWTGSHTWHKERVDRTGPNKNCDVAGDFICDTYPDYDFNGFTCTSPATFTDPAGESFTVDSSLFMSYGFGSCMNRFSPEQVQVMHANLLLASNRQGFLDYSQELNFEPVSETHLNYPLFADMNVPTENVLFRWQDAGNVEYYFTLYKNNDPEDIIEILTEDTEVIIPELEAETVYKWTVKPLNSVNFCVDAPSESTFLTTTTTAMQLTALEVEPSECAGQANALVALTVGGGEAPYTYTWEDGFEGNERNDLSGGDYIVTVEDGSGTVQEFNISVGTASEVNVSVGVEDGVATTFSDAEEDGEYTYIWSDGSTETSLEGIENGQVYTLLAMNDKGCEKNIFFEIQGKDQLYTVEAIINGVKCLAENNGSVVFAQPTWGNGPYDFVWSDGETGSERNDLAAGTYTVTITDGPQNNTMTVDLEIIGPEDALDAEVSVDNSLATAEIAIRGGEEPYEIAWSNGDTGTNAEFDEDGEYEVIITDANGCTFTKSFEVTIISGIGDVLQSSFEVYPNPISQGQSSLYINLENELSKKVNVAIYDNSGKLIQSEFFGQETTQNIELKLKSLQAGLYFVKIRLEKEELSQKLIVL